jgi:hypothetical protein
MNCRKRSLAFVSILQRLSAAEIAMRYICEIFAAPRFSSFSTQSTNADIAASHLMSVGTISSLLSGRDFSECYHLRCLSIASSSSSSDRGEMPSTRNPGKLSEAVVSICISST